MTTFKIFDVTIKEQFGFEGGHNEKPESFSFVVGKVQVSEGDFNFIENTPLSALGGIVIIYPDDDYASATSIGVIKYLEFREFTQFEIKIFLPLVQYERILLLGTKGCFPKYLNVEIVGAESPIRQDDVFKQRVIRGALLSSPLMDSENDGHLYL
jgi:hypothetical protein